MARKKSSRILYIDTSTNLAVIEHGLENYTLEYLHEKRLVMRHSNPIMLFLIMQDMEKEKMEIRAEEMETRI